MAHCFCVGALNSCLHTFKQKQSYLKRFIDQNNFIIGTSWDSVSNEGTHLWGRLSDRQSKVGRV